MVQSLGDRLSSVTSLTDLDSRETVGFDGDKAAGRQALAELGVELAELQERLHARGTVGDPRSVLLVLQGMDTSGKGGVVNHVVGLVDPLGVRVTSFKRPTPEELAHDFLWRIEKQLPAPGQLVVFDRSHYEDVLAARVRRIVEPAEVERRYDAIVAFKADYVARGGTLVKCLLHIDRDDQRDRLLARMDDPTKHWKLDPGDLDDRDLWTDYQVAYDLVLRRTSTDVAPWYVVPSGRKWYRSWAVATILLERLRALDLTWPETTVDVEASRRRLLDEQG